MREKKILFKLNRETNIEVDRRYVFVKIVKVSFLG